ncbi:MAG TPA: hypothetical protein VJB11_00770 [archaeon]|nr:hypothetical protein [archaeon]
MLETITGMFSGIGSNMTILLLILFILFVFSIKKVFSVFLNVVWIVAAAVLVPLVLSKVLGLPIAIDTDSLIFYITLGLGAYLIFLLGKAVYTILGMAEKAGKDLTAPIKRGMEKRQKKLKKKMDEYVEDE